MVIVSTGLLKSEFSRSAVLHMTAMRSVEDRRRSWAKRQVPRQRNKLSNVQLTLVYGDYIFPYMGEAKGWEDFRPDSESVFRYVSSWPIRRWYSFGCVGPLMGAGWRFFVHFFLPRRCGRFQKLEEHGKKLKRNNYCEFRCDSHFWDRQKLKTSWAQDTPPNAIPLADQAGFIKDY